jgi:SAM-dependent methyltransferase
MAAEANDRRWSGTMPETYDRYLGSAVFAPHAADLAGRASALSPTRVLELAAGTGILTGQLVKALPHAGITATDLNQAMVDYASARVSGPSWRQADAQRLPFDDGTFDLVVCQFGVMFFPDRRAAFGEVARVLTPGGTFLFNTWDALERNEFTAALEAGVLKAFPEDPPTFVVRIPHGYTDLDAVKGDVNAVGFHVREAITVALSGHADSAAGLATGFCYGTPLRMAIEQRGDLDASAAIVSAEMTASLGSGPVSAPLTAHVVTARRD